MKMKKIINYSILAAILSFRTLKYAAIILILALIGVGISYVLNFNNLKENAKDFLSTIGDAFTNKKALEDINGKMKNFERSMSDINITISKINDDVSVKDIFLF